MAGKRGKPWPAIRRDPEGFYKPTKAQISAAHRFAAELVTPGRVRLHPVPRIYLAVALWELALEYRAQRARAVVLQAGIDFMGAAVEGIARRILELPDEAARVAALTVWAAGGDPFAEPGPPGGAAPPVGASSGAGVVH